MISCLPTASLTGRELQGGHNLQFHGEKVGIKYAIRLPFIRTGIVAGKSILATIKDSVFTISKGKNRVSLAERPLALQGFLTWALDNFNQY